ncbi:EAL domain-containing protein [Erythrobacter sp.]|uniref:putative bifunctional diguanylate cyclase/phosphodiesterase n=1 Tax=Erythrobacter sp. TaxID=1042 RepID=UPI0025FADCFA|nr:EAL domain-containing protein [Erythrobacter sp.]
MNTWPIPADEAERLAQLPHYRLFGSQPEPIFDAVAEAAALSYRVPVSLISVVGEQDQWLKARWGTDMSSTPREHSFCAHTIAARELFLVPDATKDERFSDNPLVTAGPGIRFYAGQPIINDAGIALGALCLIDTVPRPDIGRDQLELLGRLAQLISRKFDARRDLRLQSAVSGFTRSSGVAIVTTDEAGAITFWNAAAEKMFGHRFSQVEGRDIALIIPDRFRSDHHHGLMRISAGGQPRLAGKAVEVIGLHHDGHEIPIEIALSAWTGPHGWEFGAQIQDISARHARDVKLRHLAVHDPLTGLPNRKEFSDRLTETLETHGSAAVLMLDLDGFKSVNDTLGHLTGDDLLRVVSVRLAAQLPSGALLARMGGDEFAVLLAGCEDPIKARRAGQKLLTAFDRDYSVGGHELRLSTSIGFALAPLHASDAEELLLRADLALIEAKRHTEGGLRVFDLGLENKLLAQRAFRDEVRQATIHQEWQLHYQPQLRLADDTLAGAEALLRWVHPTRGLITPGIFLETLEQHVVAADVGRWVIDEACAQLIRARRSGIPLPSISVNLFAIQLRSAGIERTVLDVLDHHGLEPCDLELELTETVVLRQDTRSLAELRALRRAGVRIAFDDFGTGFASFSTLKSFPVDKLKIDKSFVCDIARSAYSRAIVGGIAHLALELGLELVAEGVETTAQRDTLLELGCNIGQGYLWGLPAPLLESGLVRAAM